MNRRILQALLCKEALRHRASPGGLVLLLLVVAAALLLSLFLGGGKKASLPLPARSCFVDYWHDDALLARLRQNVPAELADRIHFRPAETVPTDDSGIMQYPPAVVAIQLRGPTPSEQAECYRVCLWHFGNEDALAPYEAWLWQQAYQMSLHPSGDAALPMLACERLSLISAEDARAALATALVLFAVFFSCVYLMPSFACEERERGTLLAQALTPAPLAALLIGRLLFYLLLAAGIAAVVAGLLAPVALARPFFWLTLSEALAAAAGIGATIATLARTQRGASLAAMSYTLCVAGFLLGSRLSGLPSLAGLVVEAHCPRLLQAALAGHPLHEHSCSLALTAILAGTWNAAAVLRWQRTAAQ